LILYLDTSARVKLYVHEPGSKELRAYTNKAVTLAASVSRSGPLARSRSRGRSFVGQFLIRSALTLHTLFH